MPCDRSDKYSGFTLLEVLISITILGMLSVALLSSLRTGLLAWEKGSARIQEMRRLELTSETLRSQLRGALPLVHAVRDGEQVRQEIAFEGTRDGIRFTTRDSFKEGRDVAPRWVEVRWQPDADRGGGGLIIEERQIIPPSNTPSASASWRGEILRSRSCSFDFLDAPQTDGAAKWTDTWEYPLHQSLPRAVRWTCESPGAMVRAVVPLDYAVSAATGLRLQ